MTVRFLHHIALAVPDLSVGHKFYTDFGLDGRAEGNRAVFRCADRDQDQMVLVEGKSRKLHYVSFGARPDAMPALQQRLEAAGVRLLDPPNESPGPGLWFKDVEGMLVNVRAAESAPWNNVANDFRINGPGHLNRVGVRGFPPRDMVIKPRRLGHVLRFTARLNEQVDFYTRIVGLKLSDRSQDIIAFLRSGEGNSDHHIFGLIADSRPGFHHASFEVANVDEVGLAACRLLDKGYQDGWGFGRHVIGSNFFHYVRDPWHGMAEYFCDIDYIPADMQWEPKNYPPEDSLYVWGPNVPEQFPMNFEGQE